MIIVLIAILLLISFLWALWSLREMKTPSMKKAREELQKGRVIFYDSASSSDFASSLPSSPSSSKSSSRETSGLPSLENASSRTNG